MTSATEDGRDAVGEFSQGGFEVSQEPGSSDVTLALRGGDFSKCRTKAAETDRSTVGGPEIRRLFVDAEGSSAPKGASPRRRSGARSSPLSTPASAP